MRVFLRLLRSRKSLRVHEAPRRTKEEARRRKDLVAQARSRHLKVGSKSSHEIQRMLTKDKRTQPRVMDLLSRQEEEKKKKEEELKEAEEEGEEEAIASRAGGTVAKPKTSDNEVDITERRERHRKEPSEKGGGGIPKPNPNPVSIMPKAYEGEISQEGGGRRSILGVGKRNLGPIPNNVKPNPSLGGASGRRMPV